MAKPLPWSFTHWDEFTTCPRLFYAMRVAKSIPWEGTDAQTYGMMVHKAFEKRQSGNKEPLPDELAAHEPYMQSLDDLHGKGFAEYEACLNKKLEPCTFFARDVWLRQKIDYIKITHNSAFIVDYKTGNPQYPKPAQLKLNALAIFIAHPSVEMVRGEFYWTQIKEPSKPIMMLRADASKLWGEFLPGARQMLEAYQNDEWQPRQNFKCNGFCALTDCEFWKPRRIKK